MDGNLTHIYVDKDGDGTIDETRSNTYDLNGNIIKMEWYVNYYEIQSISYYTYDSNENLIKKEIDEGGDGTIESAYIYTYDCW